MIPIKLFQGFPEDTKILLEPLAQFLRFQFVPFNNFISPVLNCPLKESIPFEPKEVSSAV